MSIILLRGYSQSGKDFVGKVICDTYGYKRFAFADSLKRIIAATFNSNIDDLYSQEGKLKICENDLGHRTYRQILIDEALRLKVIDEDVFAKECCKEIIKFCACGIANKIIITDWRFPNELKVVRDYFPNHKIYTIHIQRSDQLISPVNNISEYHLTNYKSDYSIINNMNNTIYDEITKVMSSIQ